MALAKAVLRIARPTPNIDALLPFYRDALGFQVLFRFHDHEGFDGIMLGHPGAGYHLEFTTRVGHDNGRAPSEENLLVFYLPEEGEYRAAVGRMEGMEGMEGKGVRGVRSLNPYWEREGRTFEDPDGYRVVLVAAASQF